MGKFKLGDRVRRIDESHFPLGFGRIGEEYQVLGVEQGGIVVVDGYAAASVDSFELVRAPLKLEAGKYYRTRDGRKVGPMEFHSDVGLIEKLGDGRIWSTNGEFVGSPERDVDLIAEWVDEPKKGEPAPMVLRDGKIFFEISTSGPSRVIRQLVKTKQGYGFEIARQGGYVWVDTGSTAPLTLKAADVVLADVQVAA